eukprot:scaffold425696_cov16-Prasinocladus_malaysianus.AAC.1
MGGIESDETPSSSTGHQAGRPPSDHAAHESLNGGYASEGSSVAAAGQRAAGSHAAGAAGRTARRTLDDGASSRSMADDEAKRDDDGDPNGVNEAPRGEGDHN